MPLSKYLRLSLCVAFCIHKPTVSLHSSSAAMETNRRLQHGINIRVLMARPVVKSMFAYQIVLAVSQMGIELGIVGPIHYLTAELNTSFGWKQSMIVTPNSPFRPSGKKLCFITWFVEDFPLPSRHGIPASFERVDHRGAPRKMGIRQQFHKRSQSQP